MKTLDHKPKLGLSTFIPNRTGSVVFRYRIIDGLDGVNFRGSKFNLWTLIAHIIKVRKIYRYRSRNPLVEVTLHLYFKTGRMNLNKQSVVKV